MATIEMSCAEIWQEVSNYIDDDSRAWRSGCEWKNISRDANTASLFWTGLGMLSAWSAMAGCLTYLRDSVTV